MRRAEFKCDDPEEFGRIMQTAELGYLGIITPDGYPRVVTVNFVSLDGRVYFHSASAGEKYEVFKSNNPRVTFTVAIPYSTIPSYWLSEEFACHATTLYKSVCIRGKGRIVDDIEEKARAFQCLVKKHQPEGGYKPISPTEQIYKNALSKVAILRVDPIQIDVRNKFAQYLSAEKRRELMVKLEERNQGADKLTAIEIGKTLGH